MFADAMKLLAVLFGVGWLGLLVRAVDRRLIPGGLLGTVGLAVLLFGALAELGDDIDDTGGAATGLDVRAQALVLTLRTPMLTAVAQTLNVAGGIYALVLLTAVATGVLLLCRRWVEAGLVAAAPVAATVLGRTFKLGYDRSRPPASGHLVTVSDSSLPSGHALDATIVLGVLALVAVSLLRARWARVAVVAVAAVGIAAAGAARVYLGVHWVTDVLAGWMFGGAWVAFSAALLLLARRPLGAGWGTAAREGRPLPG